MAVSSIAKHPDGTPRRLSATMDPAFRLTLGAEIRRRRLARRLTQGDLAAPLTRAFVSSVEAGRTVPSLPALRHLANRLDVPLSDLFDSAERAMSNPS